MLPRVFGAASRGRARTVLVQKPPVCWLTALVSLAFLLAAPLRAPGQAWPAVPSGDSSFENVNLFSTGAANRILRSDVLDLEPAVGQAELIVAVRLVDVTETKIIHSGRNVRSPNNSGSSRFVS